MAGLGLWNKLMRSLGLQVNPKETHDAKRTQSMEAETSQHAGVAPPGDTDVTNEEDGKDMSGAVGAKAGGTVAQANPAARKTGTASKAKAKSAPKSASQSGSKTPRKGKSRNKT